MRKFFRQYAHFYKDYRLYFFLGLAGMVVAAVATSAIAYLVKPVLDDIFINRNEAMLTILPLLVIIAYLGKGGGVYVQTYFISYIGRDIVRRVRDSLLEHILRLDIEFYYRYRSGELISRLTNDIQRVQEAVSNYVAVFIREVLTIIGLVCVIIYMSPKLAFFGLVVLPLAFYPLSVLAQKMKKISTRSQEKNSDITATLSEMFNNIEIIKAHASEEVERERFEKHNLDFFKIDMRGVRTSEFVNPFMEFLGSIAAALVIFFGGTLVLDGELSVGEFFSFMTALFMLYTPINTISKVYNKFQNAIAANDRINQLKELTPSITGGTITKIGSIERVSIEDVRLHYGEFAALKGVSLELVKGEPLAIVGDSGSGKSSLVSLLLRFYDPTSGRILLDGVDCRELALKTLREKVSIITQRVYIFNDTIAGNVAYGYVPERERVEKALKAAHAWEFVQRLERGMDTMLDEFGTNLSGGQRQRIAIARALYKNPDILIMDEATSALDNVSEGEINRAISEISKDRITLIIAHKLSSLKQARKIAVFKEGELVCYENMEDARACEEFIRLYR